MIESFLLRTDIHTDVYHMTSLFSSGKRHEMESVMITRVSTFAGKRNVRNNNVNFHKKYVHFEGDKIIFSESYDKKNLTLVVISYEIY